MASPSVPAAGAVPVSARAQARAEVTRRILEAARRHLAEQGAAALSLRAIARDLGMVSSAVYRYVPSRDDLLTRLIVEAYDALGAAAEEAEAVVGRADVPERWSAVCSAVRSWALAHPHEYALVYGSPVPGYHAPPDTVGPATRVSALLVGVLAGAVAAGAVPLAGRPQVPPSVSAAIAPVRQQVPAQVPDDLVCRGVLAWSTLLSMVAFEIFGHLEGVVEPGPAARDAFFAHQIRLLAEVAGLA